MRHIFVFIALMLGNLFSLSCQRFHKDFETIAMRCGVEPTQVDRNRIALALVTESGDSPSKLTLESLSARFVDSNGGVEKLNVSPGSCLFVPSSDGVLQAHSPDTGLHLSMPLKASSLSNLDEVVLKKKTLVDFQLLCPKDGLYSNGKLSLPLYIKGQGNLESLSIQLQADAHVLSQKAYGEASWDLPSQLSLSHLPAGTYRLKLSYQSSMDAWDVPAPALADCPLSIQTEAPLVQGLHFARSTMDRPIPVKQGELLNWYAESPIRSELRSCREELAADEDALGLAPLECQPKAECLDEKNFELHEQKRAVSPGLFHYFVYAEDRAGNRSALQCERIVVSDAAPRIDLAWKNPKWNIPLSVMEEAALDIEAVAGVTHPGLSDAGLLKDLECKVDFRINSNMVMPGRDVVCTNESCQGRTLEDYQTCGPDIRFNLGRFWGEQKAQRMEMRVHVRSSDRAGHWQETSRSLWIYPERFKPLTMPMPADRGSDIVEARDGTIYLANNSDLFRWNETIRNWDRIELPVPTELKALDLHQDGLGDLYVVWRKDNTLGVLQQNGKLWEAVPDHPVLPSCLLDFFVHPESGFFCQKETEPAMHWKDKQWQVLDLPESCDVFEYFSADTVDCRNSFIHQKIGGSWQELPPLPVAVLQTIRDSKNRPWVLGARQNPALPDSLSYFEDGRWKTIDSRPKPRAKRYLTNLYADPSGPVYYDDAAFMEATGGWRTPLELELAFPHIVARLKHDQLKRTWFMTDHGMGLYTAKGFRFYPLAAFGIAKVDNFLLDSRDRLWILTGVTDDAKSIQRFDPVNWHSYREEAGIKVGEAYSRIWPLWINSEGLPEFLFSYGGVMQGTAHEGWKKMVPAVTSDETLLVDVMLNGQGERIAHDWNNLFVIKEGLAEKITDFINRPNLSVHPYPDAKGRLWFNHMGTRDFWILDGRKVIPAPLPESFVVKSGSTRMFVLPERILVYSDGKFLEWNEGNMKWEARTPMEVRLPDFAEEFLQIGPDHLVVQMKRGLPVRLQTRSGRDLQIIPKPPLNSSTGKFVHSPLGLLFISFKNAIYLYKKDKWITLLSAADIAPRLESLQPVEFSLVALDPWQRLWIAGKNFKLMRLDSGPEIPGPQ